MTTGRRRVVCILPRTERIQELAEACFRFSPRIALREQEAVFLDVDEHPSLLKRIYALCLRFEAKPVIAISKDAPTAYAIAKFGIQDASRLPVEALIAYASPFYADEDIARQVRRMGETLQKLGITTLLDFSRLPPRTLASRFGSEGLELSRAIQSGYLLPWPRFQAPERIFEKIELCDSETLSPCADLESLLFVLKTAMDRAMARLRARNQRAAAIDLEFELDDQTTRSWKLALPLPQGSAGALLPILRDRLSFDLQLQPLTSPVTIVRFGVPETAPGHGAQRDFFNSKEDEAEAWDALVGRLAQKLGKNRAFVAQPVDRHLPEGAWQAASDPLAVAPTAHLPLQQPKRPSRLLKTPEALQREGDYLLHASRTQHWRAIEWHGPERLSGEWWTDTKKFPLGGFQRDYYRILTESGEQLWVFAVRNELYLHGYFD